MLAHHYKAPTSYQRAMAVASSPRFVTGTVQSAGEHNEAASIVKKTFIGKSIVGRDHASAASVVLRLFGEFPSARTYWSHMLHLPLSHDSIGIVKHPSNGHSV